MQVPRSEQGLSGGYTQEENVEGEREQTGARAMEQIEGDDADEGQEHAVPEWILAVMQNQMDALGIVKGTRSTRLNDQQKIGTLKMIDFAAEHGFSANVVAMMTGMEKGTITQWKYKEQFQYEPLSEPEMTALSILDDRIADFFTQQGGTIKSFRDEGIQKLVLARLRLTRKGRRNVKEFRSLHGINAASSRRMENRFRDVPTSALIPDLLPQEKKGEVVRDEGPAVEIVKEPEVPVVQKAAQADSQNAVLAQVLEQMQLLQQQVQALAQQNKDLQAQQAAQSIPPASAVALREENTTLPAVHDVQSLAGLMQTADQIGADTPTVELSLGGDQKVRIATNTPMLVFALLGKQSPK